VRKKLDKMPELVVEKAPETKTNFIIHDPVVDQFEGKAVAVDLDDGISVEQTHLSVQPRKTNIIDTNPNALPKKGQKDRNGIVVEKIDVKPSKRETLDLRPAALPKQGSKDGNGIVTSKIDVKPKAKYALELKPTVFRKID